MTKLSLAEVEMIAELAKLALTAEEKAMFQEQLSEILAYAQKLQQLDTTGIPPTTSALPLDNVMRADELALSLPNEVALFNAPDAEEGSLQVRAVLD